MNHVTRWHYAGHCPAMCLTKSIINFDYFHWWKKESIQVVTEWEVSLLERFSSNCSSLLPCFLSPVLLLPIWCQVCLHPLSAHTFYSTTIRSLFRFDSFIASFLLGKFFIKQKKIKYLMWFPYFLFLFFVNFFSFTSSILLHLSIFPLSSFFIFIILFL